VEEWLQAVCFGEVRIRHQEPNPEARMPKALHPESWTASDLRPDEDETKQLQPAHDATGSGLEPCPSIDPHDTPPYPSIAPYPPRLHLLCQLRQLSVQSFFCTVSADSIDFSSVASIIVNRSKKVKVSKMILGAG
jgi:hypothetical protein